jgi:hypothetical protein
VARKIHTLDPQSQRSTLVRLNIVGDMVWESLVACALGGAFWVHKHSKVMLFLVCVLVAYIGYSTRRTEQTSDPIAWITLGCAGMGLFLLAYFLWWVTSPEMNISLELAQDE